MSRPIGEQSNSFFCEAVPCVPRVKVPREREPSGRERWLDTAEVAALERAIPREWWVLFAALVFTGMRIGEALGLRWSNVCGFQRGGSTCTTERAA